MKYDYPEGTQVYKCEHEQKRQEENPLLVSYLSVYAGEKVRFEMCRLCSTMALGVIASSRIKETAVDLFQRESNDKLEIND